MASSRQPAKPRRLRPAPVAPIEPQEREVLLHGHRVRYLEAGEGPPLCLIHGITSGADCWAKVIPHLASAGYRVIAPDLLGHGQSAKPRGDSSLGAHASGIRDLLAALGIDRVTLMGHSLGGGIALQFAYQFPERTERMVLVSSGGLGPDVSVLLRLAALPGSELVLPLLVPPFAEAVVDAVGKLGCKLRLRASPDLAEVAKGFLSLGDPETRAAFIHTLRGVVDIEGQRVSATDRLYLAADLPTLVVWGEEDPIIPARHATAAADHIPGAHTVVFPRAGHFPHLDDPQRFVFEVTRFLHERDPAKLSTGTLREKLLAGPPPPLSAAAASG